MATAGDSVRRARPLLGTFVEIAVAGRARSDMNAAIDAAFEAIAKVHRLMSFQDGGSDVGRLNREAGARAVEVDAWTFEVLQASHELHRRSGGIFDISVAPVLHERGLLPRLDAEAAPSRSRMRTDGIELLSGRRVRFRSPRVRIDLGGSAKGFAVDRALDVLRALGMRSGLVNAGGDLAGFGPNCHPVHIRDPRFPQRSLARVDLSNEALACSGGRHDPLRCSDAFDTAIIDPRTREPVRAVRGAAVRAPSSMLADGLTKVVMIAGEGAAALLAEHGASALFVLPAGDVRVTADWKDVVCLAA